MHPCSSLPSIGEYGDLELNPETVDSFTFNYSVDTRDGQYLQTEFDVGKTR